MAWLTREEVAGVLNTSSRQWQEDALCTGGQAGLFFPPSSAERKDERERREERAKAICAVCPVIDDCRDYALTIREPYGIWGGYTESERRRAASAQRRAAVHQ